MTHDKCSIFTTLTVESETNTWWQGIITSPESPEYLWIPLGPIIINIGSKLWQEELSHLHLHFEGNYSSKLQQLPVKNIFFIIFFYFPLLWQRVFMDGSVSNRCIEARKHDDDDIFESDIETVETGSLFPGDELCLTYVCLSYYCCYCLSLTRITFHSIHCSDSCPSVRYKYRINTGDFRSLWWDSIWWRYR